MENDKKMVELLADMLIKLDKLDTVAQKLEGLEAQQSAMAAEQSRTTNAIISLSSLLQKAVIEPADRQAKEIVEIKERLSRLEQAIIH